ncbi:hypothetical protein FRC07_003899 [Ceratobasidium sp. 392]|nr:hypothetical protein FRC07_003899 [Ceratobasidium sp. 392]
MGNFISSRLFPPKSPFTVEQIPDLNGQVIIVTGGNTGIGLETCKALLEKNAKVYLAARNKTKAEAAIDWLKQETGGKTAVFLELDLADLASVRRAADDFKSQERELHVLFNNAGVVLPSIEQRTTEGYDLSFGTNVLGHYFLTTLLLPNLSYTARYSSVRGPTRVINTSSEAIWDPPKGGIVWETLGTSGDSLAACKRLGRPSLYAQSKLGNVLFSNELARLYPIQRVVSVSLHPEEVDPYTTIRGAIKSDIMRYVPFPSWFKSLIMHLFYYPASQGALTQLYAGTVPNPENLNGMFLIPWARIGDPGPIAKDQALAEKLRAWCEEQIEIFNETIV